MKAFPTKDEDGNIIYKTRKGLPHREGDEPAFICVDGTKFWYIRGQLHRENNKPAVVWADGKEVFYISGHRYDPEAR